jgi:hypothetical protein
MSLLGKVVNVAATPVCAAAAAISMTAGIAELANGSSSGIFLMVVAAVNGFLAASEW